MDPFPCETIIWRVLPSIRKELCAYLVTKKKMKTKEVARLLGITDAAVSQYMHRKRARKFALQQQLVPAIEELAERIIEAGPNKKKMEYMKGSCALCRKIRLSGMLCTMHRKQGSSLGSCTICTGG